MGISLNLIDSEKLNKERLWQFLNAHEDNTCEDGELGFSCGFAKDVVLGGSCGGMGCNECEYKVLEWLYEPEPAKSKNKAAYAIELLEATVAHPGSNVAKCGFLKKNVLKTSGPCTGSSITCDECHRRFREWVKQLDGSEPVEPASEPSEPTAVEEYVPKSRFAAFLEVFPDARIREKGSIPTACVRDVFGEAEQPQCTGLTCRECWNALVVKRGEREQ